MTKQKIGITGAAGYIGSRVTKLLAEAGYDLILADNFSNAQVPDVKSLGIEEMDVRNVAKMSGLVDKADTVIHLAALSDVNECENKQEEAFENNVVGTQKIAWQCRQTNTPLIFPLSMQTLGTNKNTPLEPDQERHPANFYGTTKALGEDIIRRLADCSFPAISFIKSNVYGTHVVEGQKVTKGTVINYFVDQAMQGNDITVYKPGTQVRDFIHVKDVARAYRRAIKRVQKQDNALKSYFLASGTTYTIMEIAEIVRDKVGEITDNTPDIQLVPNPRDADNLVKSIELNMERTRQELGFKNQLTVQEGIHSMIDGWSRDE